MTPPRDSRLLSQSIVLVGFFLLSICSPMVGPVHQEAPVLDKARSVQFSSPFTAESGYGHDFGGMTVNYDGLDQAMVRQESVIDQFSLDLTMFNTSEHPGTPDVKLTRYAKQHWCWSTQEGNVRTWSTSSDLNTSLVDSVAPANATELVDCAIAVTANEMQRVLYADGPDLKMGRYALESQTYWDGPRWHTRTIMENVNATDLELAIHPDGVEWGLMRTADGRLHQVNFSGAYWSHSVLEQGPVGRDIVLHMDEDGVAHVLYTLGDEVVLLRVDGTDRDRRLLSNNANTVDTLGMDLDSNNIEQVATATQSGQQFSIDLIRSLAGQNTGRVDPTPTAELSAGLVNASEGHVMLADVNNDGFDDVLMSTPTASTNGFTQNGRLDVYYGSSHGVATSPNLTVEGSMNEAHLGAGLAVGDVNDDNIADVILGVPGYRTDTASLDHGRVQVHHGSNDGLSTTVSAGAVGFSGERLGSVVVVLERNGANAMAVSAHNFSQVVDSSTTHQGKVNIYTTNGSQLVAMRNLTQTEAGDMFGRSLSSCDINGDGLDDLIIGNTGTFSNALTFSSVEYFTAAPTGFNGTPTHTVESLVQNRLFGHKIACLGDIHGDGLEDHIITEPFNGTAVFGGGKLWLYNGTTGPMTSMPDWTLQPGSGQANARIGQAIVPAGDVNEDGFNDVYISTVGGGSNGALRLYFGSTDGIQSESELIATGTNGQRVGAIAASMGDVNGDGLGELVYSIRAAPDNTADDHELELLVLSERDWEAITFTIDGTLNHMALATAGRGETTLVYAHQHDGQHHLSKLEHMDDNAPTGRWVTTLLARLPSALPGLALDVTASGQPLVVAVDTSNNSGQFIVSTTEHSYTALEQTIVSQGTMGQHLGSTLDNDGDQWLAYTSGAGQQIYFSEETTGSWSTGLVRQSAAVAGPIEVMANSAEIPHLLYRYGNQQLELAVKNGGWSLTTLGDEGEVLSTDHPSMLLSNGTLVVALATENTTQSGSDLEFWMLNGSNLSKTEVTTGIQAADLSIGLAQAANGSMMICTVDSTGLMTLHVQNGSTEWLNHDITTLPGSPVKHHLICEGSTVLAANAQHAVHFRLVDANWTARPAPSPAHANGPFDSYEHDGYRTVVSSDPQTQELRIHSLTGGESGHQPLWTTAPLTGTVPTGDMNPQTDANGTVHMAYWDAIDGDVEVLRLYVDTDRDLIFDLIDGLPFAGDQWKNTDGDGYGDNPNGPLADACLGETGTSSYISMGCPDFDADGWADSLDSCTDSGGTSWIDRYGCTDYDQDGWSDNLGSYIGGDRYLSNWKQALDTDGDGFGDNHGVDCCAVPLDQNANSGDLFPYLASQYSDYDGDGFGDNDTDIVNGDFCPWDYGTSFRDRNGCLDSDGDGSSDPSGEDGDFDAWNASAHGADVWPFDGTQWSDTDGDGYGDNNSLNATNPDQFPFLDAVATDNDLDGYPDEWTELYNGTNNNGLVLDGCLDEWGNSTSPVPGCIDSDGDGFRDIFTFSLDGETGLRINQQGDAFPDDPTQWSDEDGDGFGDQLAGRNGDRCPQQVGVLNGTAPNGASSGIGCRLVDLSDNDDDGVVNDDDTCPDSPQGASVDANGCADSQLDDDSDGVTNDADLCPNSPASSVDDQGCTSEQRNVDADNDGVNDPLDVCPGTSSGAETDSNGCADDQRDSDGDGLVDAQDTCVDTPGALIQFIDSTGCVDESALDVDVDGDGYAGLYAYEVDASTGLRINQTGDAWPSDASQWWDTDGDTYGDNSSGTQGDVCPEENGTSFRDDFGCLDDGDGWRDSSEDVSLRNDPTQWRDTDYDGFGDNWGDSTWNESRAAYHLRLNANGGDVADPGQFILGAMNADLCPHTPDDLRANVDEDGCHPSERDSDNDGVMDDRDTCPLVSRGTDGFDDGCPKATSGDDSETGFLSGTAGQTLVYGGAALAVLVLLGVMFRVMRSNEEDDDYEDDDFDDEFDDDEPRARNTSRSRRDTGAGAQSPPQVSSSRGGPSGGPSTTKSTRAGPPGASNARGPPSRSGPPKTSGPSTPVRTGGPPKKASTPAPAQKVAKKKSVSTIDEPTTKVRKAKIHVDMSVFEAWQTDDREAAVDWVADAFADGEDERTMLMQLQETGWSAEQSRAICDLAKNQ